MFRMNLLKMRTSSALRKNSVLRASVPYKHAQSVGIIFSVEDKQKHDTIKEFIRHLEQGMEVAQLAQPGDQIVVEMLVALGADIDGLAQTEGVHGHRRAAVDARH